MAARITLFTPYFAARTPERQSELDLCLERNLACTALHRVVLLVDDGHPPPVNDARLLVLAISGRPTYADWIRLSRQHAPHGITLLANSDIYFDDSVAGVHTCLAQPQRFLALSRHELVQGQLVPHPQPAWSQDVWGLQADAVLHLSLLKALDIPLGVPRCDNKVAYHFAVHGWQLANPQHLVRSVHVHETQQRNYDKTADLTVLGAVAYVHPTDDLSAASRIDIDVWARNTQAIGKLAINRSLDKWAAEREKVAKNEASQHVPRALDADSAIPVLTDEAQAAPRWVDFVSAGRRIYSSAQRFELYEHQARLLVLDWLVPDAARVLDAPDSTCWLDTAHAGLDAGQVLSLFIPPVLPVHPVQVGSRPRTPTDLHFWQYPAATERQARDNHLQMARGANLDPSTRTVHTYLGLPWATYIDKKAFPEELRQWLPARLDGLAELARSMGWRLAVHTVCQQIHWRRLIDDFIACRVTDLHLSHATDDLDPQREGWPLRVHSWPLMAPNIEDPTRREGLVFGKPPSQRKYLASFVGAHMAHYRSEVRVQLAAAASAAARDDVLVEVGGLWHFNHVVYKEQVAGKALSAAESNAHDHATRRYNQVLSDSVFSLCPEGAGPNTLRVWESLAVGAIPVILADGWTVPAAELGQPDLRSCCIFWPVGAAAGLIEHLAGIDQAERQHMHLAGLAAYPLLRERRAFGWG